MLSEDHLLEREIRERKYIWTSQKQPCLEIEHTLSVSEYKPGLEVALVQQLFCLPYSASITALYF